MCHLLLDTPSLHAEAVQIRVILLNGKTGKPITNAEIDAWERKFITHGRPIRTDRNDSALIDVDPKQPATPPLAHYWQCSEDPAGWKLDLNKIMSAGLLAHNSCGLATVVAHPGEWVLFFRPYNFLERIFSAITI